MAQENVSIVSGNATTQAGGLDCTMRSKLPLPNIVILIHGVNDVGEAFSAQELGLCAGLNQRLNRSHADGPSDKADLSPANYNLPPKVLPLVPDPDAVYFRRSSSDGSYSPVVPFYWGLREEEDKIKKNEWHGQWTDRHGNRLDKNGGKGGGPFANATSNLVAIWGHGFTGKVMNSETIANFGSGPTHDLRKAEPRYYMLLAAKRLAMLIKMIRGNPLYKEAGVNLLCHSQGGMISLLAQAILKDEGENIAIDTLILQDPPYSLREPSLERKDGVLHDNQQTSQARIKTLVNLVNYVGSCRVTAPPLAQLNTPACEPKGCFGPQWKPGSGALQWINSEKYAFTERDNRGKVYLYFCPYDETVALMSVQGIGWDGIPNILKDVPTGKDNKLTNEPVFSLFDQATFRQRVFTARKVDDKPELVGTAPHEYELRSEGWIPFITRESSTTKNLASKGVEKGAKRMINGEELSPTVEAQLFHGEVSEGKLRNGPIDGAIAIAADGGIKTTRSIMPDTRRGPRFGAFPLTDEEMRELETRINQHRRGNDPAENDQRLRVREVGPSYDENHVGQLSVVHGKESADEARKRWQEDSDDNSHHSSIPGNPLHAERVTAYDVCLGHPLPNDCENLHYLDFLRYVADWRTDWQKLLVSDKVSVEPIKKAYGQAGGAARTMIDATALYYKTGILPADIFDGQNITMGRPSAVSSQTLTDREKGIAPT